MSAEPTAHVLAAVDFSPLSEAVVERAAQLAGALGVPLTLLHVAAPPPDFVGYEVGPQNLRDARATELWDEHHRLQEMADGLRAHGLEARALMVQGPTVERIVAEAEKLGAGLLVLGRHGQGALSRVLLGSVSEAVLRAAPCPVLILPPAVEEAL